MSNIRVPHFDYPFRLGASGHVVEVEQDSVQEIETCIATILLTPKGQRFELPEFGIDSPLFRRQPLPIDSLYSEIVDQEPRALIIISQRPSISDYLTALINVTVQNQQPVIGAE